MYILWPGKCQIKYQLAENNVTGETFYEKEPENARTPSLIPHYRHYYYYITNNLIIHHRGVVQGIIDSTETETSAKEPQLAKYMRKLKSTAMWCYKKTSTGCFPSLLT